MRADFVAEALTACLRSSRTVPLDDCLSSGKLGKDHLLRLGKCYFIRVNQFRESECHSRIRKSSEKGDESAKVMLSPLIVRMVVALGTLNLQT